MLASAQALSGRASTLPEPAVAAMEAVEGYHAYPGPKLFALLRERIAANDAGGASRLARRTSNGLMTRARSTGRSASDAPGMSAPISG